MESLYRNFRIEPMSFNKNPFIINQYKLILENNNKCLLIGTYEECIDWLELFRINYKHRYIVRLNHIKDNPKQIDNLYQ